MISAKYVALSGERGLRAGRRQFREQDFFLSRTGRAPARGAPAGLPDLAGAGAHAPPGPTRGLARLRGERGRLGAAGAPRGAPGAARGGCDRAHLAVLGVHGPIGEPAQPWHVLSL
jgi:hypothetical protein